MHYMRISANKSVFFIDGHAKNVGKCAKKKRKLKKSPRKQKRVI
jgi:hypothetical protein